MTTKQPSSQSQHPLDDDDDDEVMTEDKIIQLHKLLDEMQELLVHKMHEMLQDKSAAEDLDHVASLMDWLAKQKQYHTRRWGRKNPQVPSSRGGHSSLLSWP